MENRTKTIILILFMLSTFILKAQTITKKNIDTISIVFKSKIFTISQHGYKKKADMIDFIDSLPYEIYGNDEFTFIKIKSRYYCYDKTKIFTANWCDCEYYVVYSIKKDVFYLIGGFENDNIKEFYTDYKSSFFSATWDYDDIKDKKLKEFLKNLLLGDLKKARKSFTNCKEIWEN